MESNEMNQTSEPPTPGEEPVVSVEEPTEVPNEEPEETPNEEPPKKKKSFWREVGEWVGSLAAALVIVLLIQNFLFTLIAVDGNSMYDTLADGERLFVTVYDVKFGTVDRGDVVICHYPNRGNTLFVKRVVAVPGASINRETGVTHVVYETVDENGDTVTVDEALDAEYVSIFYNPSDDYEAYTLGEDEYFVVGDNRGNSHDSRDWNDSDSSNDVGPITGDMITGHVRFVIWPFSDIRAVE